MSRTDRGGRLNLLFVCSRNHWRSPTAERVFGRRQGVEVRSRGLAASARRKLAQDDVLWADLIFVMEDEHRRRLVRDRREALADTPVHVLDIPDDYGFMDPELVELLEAAVEPHLAGSSRPSGDRRTTDGIHDQEEGRIPS